MAASFVQSAFGAWTSGTTYTATITPTAGNLLAVGAFIQSLTGSDQYSSIGDNQSNAYTAIDVQNVVDSGVNNGLRTFYVKNVAGGATTITVTLQNSTLIYAVISISEFSGLDTVAPLDAHTVIRQVNPGSGTDTITTAANPTTTTVNGEAIFGFTASLGTTTMTAGTGYTQREAHTDTCSEDLIQGTAGSIVVTFSPVGNTTFYTALATFQPVAGIAPGFGVQELGWYAATTAWR